MSWSDTVTPGEARGAVASVHYQSVGDVVDRPLQHRDINEPIERLVREHLGDLGIPAIHYGSLTRALQDVVHDLIVRAQVEAVAKPQEVEPREAWHEFHDGPWAGERVEVETSPDGYEHLLVHRPIAGVGEWVPAKTDPHRGRYVRTGNYGETTVMTWKQA
jgi:hypothetical protein